MGEQSLDFKQQLYGKAVQNAHIVQTQPWLASTLFINQEHFSFLYVRFPSELQEMWHLICQMEIYAVKYRPGHLIHTLQHLTVYNLLVFPSDVFEWDREGLFVLFSPYLYKPSRTAMKQRTQPLNC